MIFSFDGTVVDAASYKLVVRAQEVSLERRVFDVLHYLIVHRDRVVSREELLENLWQVRTLSDGALSNNIATLRRALGQRVQDGGPIRTVHGRGYRFVAEVVVRNRPTVNDASPVQPREVESPSLPSPSDPFVGRDALMQRLQRFLEPPYGGSENVIVLSGEAGIGKTRAARQLASQARLRGFSVWTGTAVDDQGVPLYWPVIEILRSAYAELAPETWAHCAPTGATRITHLLPDQTSVDADGIHAMASAHVARFQLFDEVAYVLRSASRLRPRLIVLDDLHHADRGTVELLAFVARSLQQEPLVWLVTLRTDAPSRLGPANAPLEQLGRLATIIELGGLTEEDVSQLAREVVGASARQQATEPGRIRALHSRTHGNPLFLRQTLDLLARNGNWEVLDEKLSIRDLPPAIGVLVRQRLATLPDTTRRVLRAAAVVGQTFDAWLVAKMLDIEMAELLEAIEPAVRINAIESRASEIRTYSFCHELVQDTLLDDIPAHEHGALHHAAAQALSGAVGHDRGTQLAALAHHSLLAVPFDLERAVSACRQAAAAAQVTSGFERAVQLLQSALVRVELAGGEPSLRFRLWFELAEYHFYAGLIVDAVRAYRAAVQVARATGDLDSLVEVVPRLVDCFKLCAVERDFVLALVEQTILVLPDGDIANEATLTAQRAELAVELTSVERLAMLDRAADLAARAGSTRAVLEVANSRTMLRIPTQPAQGADAALQYLELQTKYQSQLSDARSRTPLRRFGAYVTLYLSSLTTCDVSGADEHLATCTNLAQQSRIPVLAFWTQLMRAGRALGDGRLDTLRAVVAEMSLPVGLEVASAAAALAGYRRAAGPSRAHAQREVQFGDEAAQLELACPMHPVYVAIERAHDLVARGSIGRARAVVGQLAPAKLACLLSLYGGLGPLCKLAEIYVSLEDAVAIDSTFERLAPHAQLNAVGPCFDYLGAVSHYLGLLARAQGRAAVARAHFEHAITINRGLSMPRMVAASQREAGKL